MKRAATVALAVALTAALAGWQQSAARAATAAEVTALQLQPCPEQQFLSAGRSTPERRASALEGRFEPLRGMPADLTSPIDWHQDPFDNRSWVFSLHSLSWMTPLLDLHAEDGEAAALASARDFALDWIASVAADDTSYGPLSWEAKTAGDRAGRIAYLARAAACEGFLTDSQAGAFIDSVRNHAQHLTQPGQHPANNHGLFSDYGLALIAFHFPFLAEAATWGELAENRFTALVRSEISPASDLFLEHSPSYQELMVRLVEHFLAVRPGADLGDDLARLRDSAGWFVMPGRTLVPLGDSSPNVVDPGSWLDRSSAKSAGLFSAFDAGLGIVKLRRAYLAVTAWHHPYAHRHGDDLGFHLRERGRDIVSDAGYHSYEVTGFGPFARSSDAHSVLTVDSRGLSLKRKHAYGSGLRATGRGAGWFALAGVNPGVRRQGVRHRRLFLYKPGLALVIVDRIRSRTRHRYTRRFQIAPGIAARRHADGWRLRARGFSGFLDPGRSSERLSSFRGHRDPIRGWAFPRLFEPRPRSMLVAHSWARDSDLLATIGLRRHVRARVVRGGPHRLLLAIRARRSRAIRLLITQKGRRLRIARVRGRG